MKRIHLLALAIGSLPIFALFAQQATAKERPFVLTAETDYSILPVSNENNTVILRVAITGNRRVEDAFRQPIDLVIALDRSGSMSGNKIEMARQAVLQAFETLSYNDRVALVTYSSDVETILPLTTVGQVRNPNHLVNQIRASGNTAIYAGINQAAAELRRGSEGRDAIRRIVLLSDGLANVGPSDPRDFQLLGQALAREDFAVSTVGLGLDYNEDLMANLAQGSQGNVYFVENARDLPRIFESELGDATSLVARSATLEIECQPGFRPIKIVGRSGRIEGHKVTVEIDQLYGGKTKYALIECAVVGLDTDEAVLMANVNAKVYEADGTDPVRLATTANVRFDDDLKTCRNSYNIGVQREVVFNRIALAQEEAITLADRGDNAGASIVINNLNTWITDNNTVWKDETIARNNVQLAEQAKTLEEQGMDNRTRKEMRSSSYQSKSQQSYK